MLFDGEIALVTGAGNGIGRAIAIALAKEGARVALADVNPEKGEAARAEAGGDAVFLPADLSDVDNADAVLKETVARLGPPAILVHSASPPRREADHVLAVEDEVFEAMLTVNLRSGFRLARNAGRLMRDGGIKGRMLFVTSLHAETPRNLPHYSASKAGMTMLMKELARALGPAGIRVNAIAPGAIPGGGVAADPAMAKLVPMGRLGTPEDVADMALALLSDRFARYVTGTTVVVDGGLALHNWIPPR
jgi:NAD(P)-dependent dehydrogenase (short-subunit alcohol dehydrogenase family)